MYFTLTLFSILSLARICSGSVPLDSHLTGATYPYAVHKPAGSSSKRSSSDLPPVIIMLHGQGSKGDKSQLTSNTLWNGWGMRISEYYNGNKTDVNTQTAENFMTILPLAPPSTGNWDASGVFSVWQDFKKQYSGQFDESRVYCSGYSMGSRLWFSYYLTPVDGTEHFCTALGLSAGVPGEDSGRTPGLTTDFSKMIDIPTFINTGSIDTTSLEGLAQTAFKYYKQDGGDVTLRVIDDADHGSMQDVAFDKTLLNWLTSQSGGSDSDSGSNTSSTTPEATATTTTKKHRPTATTSQVPASTPSNQVYLGDGNGIQLLVNSTSGDIQVITTEEEGLQIQMVAKRSKIERRFEKKTHSARSRHSLISKRPLNEIQEQIEIKRPTLKEIKPTEEKVAPVRSEVLHFKQVGENPKKEERRYLFGSSRE